VYQESQSNKSVEFVSRPKAKEFISLVEPGDTVIITELAVTATTFTLSLEGYTFVLNGTFPTDMGALVNIFFEYHDILDINGFFTSLSDLSGLALDSMTLTGPDGTNLLTMTGGLNGPDALDTATVTINGVVITDAMLGEDYEFNNYADYLVGDASGEFMFGLGGNDTLIGHDGHDGNDSMYGGSGNDYLVGGFGDDYLNPGDNNEGWASAGILCIRDRHRYCGQSGHWHYQQQRLWRQ